MGEKRRGWWDNDCCTLTWFTLFMLPFTLPFFQSFFLPLFLSLLLLSFLSYFLPFFYSVLYHFTLSSFRFFLFIFSHFLPSFIYSFTTISFTTNEYYFPTMKKNWLQLTFSQGREAVTTFPRLFYLSTFLSYHLSNLKTISCRQYSIASHIQCTNTIYGMQSPHTVYSHHIRYTVTAYGIQSSHTVYSHHIHDHIM